MSTTANTITVADVTLVGTIPTANIPWATPGTIGSTTPSTGAFTSISATTSVTATTTFSAGGAKFTIDANGNITKLNNVAIASWPSSNAAGALTNDGSGNFTYVAGGGGGGMAIGGAVTSGTAKSVLLVDGSGNLGQDNANFQYDPATHVLTLPGTAANSFQVGPSNRTFQVDPSTSSTATGLSVTGNTATNGVTLRTISSGTNEPLNLYAKGTGNVILGDPALAQNIRIAGNGGIFTSGLNLAVDADATHSVYIGAGPLTGGAAGTVYLGTQYNGGAGGPGVTLQAHLSTEQSGTAQATIAAGTGAGTSPTIAILSGGDTVGKITLTTGTAPSGSSTVFTVTYGNSYANTGFGNAPYVIYSPANANAAALSGLTMVYVTSNTTNFTFTVGATGLTSATQYIWYYHVIQ